MRMVVKHKNLGGIPRIYAVDLHIHTRASHGDANSADEVVTSAKEGEVRVVGVTDHDTSDGIKDVEAARDRLYPELIVVPGLEFSTDYQWKKGDKTLKMHLLGYNMKVEDSALKATLRHVRGIQRGMGEKSMELLQQCSEEYGKPLFIPDELSPVIERGQPNIREWIPRIVLGDVRNNPLVEEVIRREGLPQSDEALWKQLQKVLKKHTTRKRIKTKQAVRLLAVAGGEPVIAHVLDDENDLHTLSDEDLIEVFQDLQKAGLAGLEVYHPNHTQEQIEFLEKAAVSLRLKRTGGSDFHGREGEYVGMCGLDENPLGRVR